MRKIKRTRITIETERVLVISKQGRVVEGWCDGCGEAVQLIGLEEAAVMAGISLRAIRHQVEIKLLHCAETHDGGRLICLNSLLQ